MSASAFFQRTSVQYCYATIVDGLQKLREEWLNADPATRRMLEKRYGKVTIQQAMEESFSNEWLKQHSKQCPSCGAHIQVSFLRVFLITSGVPFYTSL